MITVLDMETGEILQCGSTAAAPADALPESFHTHQELQTGLQTTEQIRAEIRMPVDMATLDIAEFIARLR